MTLLLGLIITTAFYVVASKAIKKYPIVFYLGFYLWQAVVIAYYGLGMDKTFPLWFTKYFMDLFQKGIFSTITFIIVMFIGTITTHNEISKKLLSIRGELSIIGCFSVICHNVIFGVLYFPALIKHPELMNSRHLAASIVTIVLLVLMLPLFITSFQCVRKKMKAKSWKNLQRLAYPFYILIYVHIMILFTADVKAHFTGIIIYTMIYVTYVILRIRKYFVIKNRKRTRLQVQEA